MNAPSRIENIKIPLPPEAAHELVFDTAGEDERVWVPSRENVWFRPLLFNVAQGSFVNLTKATGHGIVSRPRPPAPVTGSTLAGIWHYPETAWVATPGPFTYPPGGATPTP